MGFRPGMMLRLGMGDLELFIGSRVTFDGYAGPASFDHSVTCLSEASNLRLAVDTAIVVVTLAHSPAGHVNDSTS